MTIQQAIEKAKQLRIERLADSESGVRSLETGEASSAARLPHSSVKASRSDPVQFREILPDLIQCRQNRLLIDSDRTSNTAAAYDAYRIVRTQLRQKSAVNGAKRFSIASAGPGEGKSTTAVNLALTLAREKRENVFLLDLDLRNPSIAEYLGIVPPVQIGHFLGGKHTADEVFFTIGVDYLAVAGGTQQFDNSSELLSGQRLEELLMFVTELDPNAWVIIDMPPLLATADALVVVPMVSGMIVVVSEGQTRRDELQRAAEMLSNAKIAGVVMNRSKAAVNSYYGYY